VQCCSYYCRSSFYSLDDGCTDTLKLQHQPYLLDTSQPRTVLHLLLKAGFAFSFPFADAVGELMTHEVTKFRDEVGKCVTGSPSRASASQQLHRQSKTNNTTTLFRASAARAT
jgi:hypothetical protein